MPVQPKPKKNSNGDSKTKSSKAVESFVDGATSKNTGKSDNKIPVSLRFDKDLLRKIDDQASRRGLSRSGFVSYWCSVGVESENST